MIDYHVHTSLCDHAQGTMEAYIQRAVDIGLRDICFLDHLTMQPSGNNLSMTAAEIPLYFQALQRLKQRYKGIINVKIGIEIDFNPAQIDLIYTITERFAFDVIGGALHFPGGLNIVSHTSAWKQGTLDPHYVYDLYLEDLHKMLDYDYFDVICHLDLLKKFGRQSDRSTINDFEAVIATVKNKDLTVEINTSGYNHAPRETYPSRDIIKRCYQHGVRVTLGSDAHKPVDVGQHYEKALPLLISAGYRNVATFERRKVRMIPIA